MRWDGYWPRQAQWSSAVGGSGVMAAAAAGARSENGLVIGIGGWTILGHHGHPLADPPTPASSPRHAVELALTTRRE